MKITNLFIKLLVSLILFLSIIECASPSGLKLNFPATRNEKVKLELKEKIPMIERNIELIYKYGTEVNLKEYKDCVLKITELPKLFIQKLLELESSFNNLEDFYKVVDLALVGYCSALEDIHIKNNFSDEQISASEAANFELIKTISWAIGIFMFLFLVTVFAIVYFCFTKGDGEVILGVDKKLKSIPNDCEQAQIKIAEPEPIIFTQSSMYRGLYSRAMPQEQQYHSALNFTNHNSKN